jgi:hypothetical protein
MFGDCRIGNVKLAIEKLFRHADPLSRIFDRLSIGKVERTGKINRQVVAKLVLRKGNAVTIADLSARRGDIKNVGARKLLRFPSRLNHLLRRRGGRRRRFLSGDHDRRKQKRQKAPTPKSPDFGQEY